VAGLKFACRARAIEDQAFQIVSGSLLQFLDKLSQLLFFFVSQACGVRVQATGL
jgi:hypothetical protein